ncbi:hypothetical protein N665_0187s0013 [Sinapis alba]|nr:hypothetical protein N665_0187s0013 [Sinapis alba]
MMSKEVAKINRDMLMLKEDQAPKLENISIVGIKPIIPDLNVKPCSDSDEEEKGEITKAFLNFAVDHKLLYQLEVEIIARPPCFEYWKLQFLNKMFLELLKSCEIFRVILLSGTESNWEMFDKDFTTFRRLPKVSSRKFSSGCFLRGKFYVLGDRDENDKHLTCGESYDEATNSWELIPDMLKDMTFIMPSQSSPLIDVVDENLYMLETSLNELRVYDINKNIWKKLGVVPVSANADFGWGIAFKSMGDRLLVVGTFHSGHRTTKVYSCCPSPDVEEQHWVEFKYWCAGAELPRFIHNCFVTFA